MTFLILPPFLFDSSWPLFLLHSLRATPSACPRPAPCASSPALPSASLSPSPRHPHTLASSRPSLATCCSLWAPQPAAPGLWPFILPHQQPLGSLPPVPCQMSSACPLPPLPSAPAGQPMRLINGLLGSLPPVSGWGWPIGDQTSEQGGERLGCLFPCSFHVGSPWPGCNPPPKATAPVGGSRRRNPLTPQV